MDDAKMLAISTIQNVNEDKNQIDNIKMLQIKSESSEFEFIDDENIKKIANILQDAEFVRCKIIKVT